MEKHNEPIEEKLKRLSRFDPDTGCLIWTGGRGGRRDRLYGQIHIATNRQGRAHIVAWECINGPRPKGFIIRHTCGNPLCINVQHMVLFKSSVVKNNIEWQLDRLKKRMIVNPNTGCWEWQGGKVRGYGWLRVGKRYIYAHRLMWMCVYRKTKGLYVLHKCDNRCCINPEHLFLGTHIDNMQDKINKNRAARKLNAEIVRDIRTSNLSPKELAKKYKVIIGTIYNVLNRRTWKHIE